MTHHSCGACGQRVRINRDGTVRVHLWNKRDHLGARTVCPGSAATLRDEP